MRLDYIETELITESKSFLLIAGEQLFPGERVNTIFWAPRLVPDTWFDVEYCGCARTLGYKHPGSRTSVRFSPTAPGVILHIGGLQ